MTAVRRSNLVDIGEVSRMLAARIQVLASELLPHGRRQGHEWMCGSPAGEPGTQMGIHLSGAKAGVWKHFAGTEGGDALDLVAVVLFGGDKGQALAWSRRWLGLDTGDARQLEIVRRAVPDVAELDRQTEAERAETRAAAKRIWLAAHPNVTDTPVDWYLRGRGIALADLARPAGAIRYHPWLWHKQSARYWPAMVTQISGPGGFLATHRTWLEITGTGTARKAPIDGNKMTLGTFRGGHISLQRGASGKPLRSAQPGELVDITEGIEDGLSVAVAMPEARVLAAATLGNMATIDLPAAITAVRIWRQNDTKLPAIEAFQRVLGAHIAAGRQVIIPEIGSDVKDVNDLLQTGAPDV